MAATQQPRNSAKLVELLQKPESYPERPRRVELLQTHISWVFLTDRFAYKLKKPVRFEFVDFSTPEARRQACHDELHLNRRMAKDVYLEVVPIVCDRHDRLAVGGEGEPVDWLVKMRRLPADRTLEALVRAGRLSEEEIETLAGTLARFYARADPLTLRPEEYQREIERHVEANRGELLAPTHGLDAALVKRVHSAQRRFLKLAPQLLGDRVCDGRVIEGHGDLRPEHIYLEAKPAVIDCVEFSRELRTLDVADELCFLAMECERIGATSVGDRVLDGYRAASGDDPPEVLLAFYKSYRASVRAKVAALRALQVDDEERQPSRELVGSYLMLADRYAAKLGPPLLIVVRGLMGTGKSTLAAELAQTLDAELLQTDAIRQEILGASGEHVAYGEGIYRPEDRFRVYEEMFSRAERLLDGGLSVVMDGTFLQAELRLRAVELARRAGALPLVVRCHCPREIARQRIADRLQAGASASEARPELFEQQQQDEEPDTPGLPTLDAKTTAGVGAQVSEVLSRVASTLGGRSSC